jgi:hypothetical protein
MTVYNGYMPLGPDSGTLSGNDYIVSPSGLYAVVMQDDGNFVVYHGTNPGANQTAGNALWATNAAPPSGSAENFGSLTSFGTFLLEAFVPGQPSKIYYQAGKNAETASVNYYMGLSDNGTVTIVNALSPGNNGIGNGQVVWSSNSSDPMVSIDLSSVNYDLPHTIYSNETTVHSLTATNTNNTDTTQTYPDTLSLSYTTTNTYNWSVSESVAIGIKSSTKIGMPGLDETLEESLTETTTITSGQSTSATEQQTYSAGGTTTVPPQKSYQTTITGTQVTADVPYTFSGVATYKSGKTAPVTGSGVFENVSANDFNTVTNDVTPGSPPTVVPGAFQPDAATAAAATPVAASSASLASPGPLTGVLPTPPQFDALPVNLGQGPDTLSLAVSEDAWGGDAQFTVSIDGKQIGGIQTVKAQHAESQTQFFNISGDFKDITHAVSVDFINDAYGGTPQTDRNLYIDQTLVNGINVPEGVISQYAQGAHTFSFLASRLEIDHPADLTAASQVISGTVPNPSQPIYLDWSSDATPPTAEAAGWVKVSVDPSGKFSAPVNIDHAGAMGTLYYRIGTGPVTAAWSDTPH